MMIGPCGHTYIKVKDSVEAGRDHYFIKRRKKGSSYEISDEKVDLFDFDNFQISDDTFKDKEGINRKEVKMLRVDELG